MAGSYENSKNSKKVKWLILMNKNYFDELLAILKRKNEYLDQIDKITEAQGSSIENKDDEQLGHLIDKKQEFIDSIDKLDKVFLDDINVIKSQYNVDSLDQIGNNIPQIMYIKDEINQIQKIINKIFSKEQENSVKLKKEYDDIKGKLKEISDSKKVLNAYSGYKMPTNGGSFFDNKK
jgi:transcriptional regulator with PAS, ATPase and Fis domain